MLPIDNRQILMHTSKTKSRVTKSTELFGNPAIQKSEPVAFRAPHLKHLWIGRGFIVDREK